jgi:O-methyltransferase
MDFPPQNYRLLRQLLPRKLQPLARAIRKRIERRKYRLTEPFYSIFPYTQAHPLRQENLLRLAQSVDANRIVGAIVECGVLDGGTAALMAYGTRLSGRAIHLFDSWQGLPPPMDKDGAGANIWEGEDVGSPIRVRRIMSHLGIDQKRLHFHVGWFKETFPRAQIDKIALLHVDGDFYESVKLTLETWAPRVVPGGYIQIDDYSAFVGCKRAVDEFLALHSSLKIETYRDVAFFISR